MNALLGEQILSRRRPRWSFLLRVLRPQSRWLGFGLLGMAMAALLYEGVLRSSYFALQEVQVVGSLKILTAREIRDALAIAPQSNLFRLSLAGLQRRVAALPWVERVSIHRALPRSLWVYVEEKKPAAFLLKDRLYFVSDHGEVFKTLGGEKKIDLPVVTGEPEEKFLGQALSLIDFFDKNDDFSLFGISEIHYNASNGFSVITLASAIEVELGWEDFETKLMELKSLWPQMEKKLGRVKRVDLRMNDRVIVKL